MKRLLLALLTLASPAFAQYTTVTATHIVQNISGGLVPAGFLCLTPVLNNQPTTVSIPGGGQVLPTQVCSPIVAGAITGMQVADTAVNSPPGFGYAVQVQGPDHAPVANFPQSIYPTGTTWSLDNWVPSSSATASPTGIIYSAAPPQGRCSFPSIYQQPSVAGGFTTVTTYNCANHIWVQETGPGGGGTPNAVPISGNVTMTGPLTLNADPSAPLQPATKNYADTLIAALGNATVPLVGNVTMTGPLTLSGDPTAPLQAVTKQYVDALVVNAGGGLPGTGNASYALTFSGSLTPGDAVVGDGSGNGVDAGGPPCLAANCNFTALPNLPTETPTNNQPVSLAVLNDFLANYEAQSDLATLLTGYVQTAQLSNFAALQGASYTGPVTLAGDPVNALDAATKQYVDNHAGSGGSVLVAFPLQNVSGTVVLNNAALAIADNSVASGPLDSNGNPHFATYTSTVIIVGGTSAAPLVLSDANGICKYTSTQTLTPTGTASVHFVLGAYTSDGTTCSALTLIDTTTASWAWHEAQTPTPSGSTANPQYGFDLDIYAWRSNTGGSWSAALTTQVVPLFSYIWTGTAVDSLGPLPYGMSWGAVQTKFGDGALGLLYATTGTTTVNGCLDYASIALDGSAVLSPSKANSATAATGLCLRSQWPILLAGISQFSTVGLGINGTAGSTSTTAIGGTQGGFGGAAGCGGTTPSAPAHAGGNRTTWTSYGGIGSAGNGVGGCNPASPSAGEGANAGWTTGAHPPPGFCRGGAGATGATGAGDGTNPGGSGASSGAPICAAASAFIVASGAGVHSDGGAGGSPTVGVVAGGGGAGAGNAELLSLEFQFLGTLGTQFTANGGPGGTHFGTGATDGTGGGPGVTALERAY